MEMQSVEEGSGFSSLTKELSRFMSRHHVKIMGVPLMNLAWDSLVGNGPVKMELKIFGKEGDGPIFTAKSIDARPLCITDDEDDDADKEERPGCFLDAAALEMAILHAFKPYRSIVMRLHIDDRAQKAIVRIADVTPASSVPLMRPRRMLVATSG